ncbi:hypothetical protein FA13DRAFT_1740990, partial [Coprinellus micaceus]
MVDLVKALSSQRQCQPDRRDHLGRTAIFYACSSPAKATPIPSILVHAFPNLATSICTFEQDTPLVIACDSGQEHIVRLLLEKDASHVHRLGPNGRTSLMQLFTNSARGPASSICTIFELLLQYACPRR